MPSNAKNIRMCCSCRGRSPKSDMLRVVKAKDGSVFIDESGTADGRGVWLHTSEECRTKTVKRKLLNAALKTAVSEEVYERIKSR